MWKPCETLQLWQADPCYDDSYRDFHTTNDLQLPLTESNFHNAYATGLVNTNNQREHIDISMEKLEIHRKGEVIATIQALTNGELLVTSTTGEEKSRICISKDRAYFFSQSGSTWQRRRLFKLEWRHRHEMIGWRGHVPLPFQVSDSICQDTDDDTKYQCLKDAQSGTLKGSGKGNNAQGSGH